MLSRIKFQVWCQLGSHTWGLKAISFIKRTGCHAVNRGTDLVIEGFPRCGNTFAYAAFVAMQHKNFKIAHHIHGSAQIANAARFNTPTILLIRKPLDSCASLLVRQPSLSPKQVLKYYSFFYRRAWDFRHKVVITSFESLTNNPVGMICDLNAKYSTSFRVAEFDTAIAQEIRDHVLKMDLEDSSHSRNRLTSAGLPSALKDSQKQIAIEILMLPRYSKELNAANVIYEKMKAAAHE